MSRGVGIAKRGFGRALSRIGYSSGGEVMDDMSEGHESMESLKEEAKETKLEKEGYKETKAGKMVKAAQEGIKKVTKKMQDHYKKNENVKFKVTPSE
jgi:DNA-binding ferritin-like protein